MSFLPLRWLLGGLLSLSFLSSAWAHRLYIFPQISDGEVVIQVTFGAKAPAVGAAVTVYDNHGAVLYWGHTDKDGRYRFAITQAQDLRIVVDDGAGHRKEQLITAQRLQTAVTPEKTPDPKPAPDEDGQARSADPFAEQYQRIRHREWQGYIIGMAILLILAAAAYWWLPRSRQ